MKSQNAVLSRRDFLKASALVVLTSTLPQGKVLGRVFRRVKASETIRFTEERTNLCFHPCGFFCQRKVLLENGRIVGIEGVPSDRFTEGKLCPKGIAAIQDVYSPYRVLYPLKRVGDGRFRRISWEQALDEIAEKLREIRAQWKDRGVGKQTKEEQFCGLAYTTPRIGSGEAALLMYRFMRAFKFGPHYGGCYACGGNMIRAQKTLLGYMGRTNTASDYVNSKLIIIWGVNLAATRPVEFHFIMKAKEKGAKIIVIDPRYSETAQKADEWIYVRPGTDGALALAILNVIFAEKLYYPHLKDYLAEGDFEKLVNLVKDYDPEDVSKITWVPADKIRELAREIASAGRRVALHGGAALATRTNGFQTWRAVLLIPIVVGAIGIPGGGLHHKAGTVGFPQLPMAGKPAPWYAFGMTVDDPYNPEEPPPDEIPELMKKGVIKFVISKGNLALRSPNAGKMMEGLEALSKNGLIVHRTLFWDEMCEYAHYILPVATEFEFAGSNLYVGTTRSLKWQDAVIEPLGEAKPDWWFWNELGKRVYGDEILTEGCPRCNPEYGKPVWPYETFKTPEGIYNYYYNITKNIMHMKLKMKFLNMGLSESKAEKMAEGMNPFSGFYLENVKRWTPYGGVIFPCPPSMIDKGGVPILFMNPRNPNVPGPFMTPDGKVHVDLPPEAWNNARLPKYEPHRWEPENKGEEIDWNEEYPLILINHKYSAVHIHTASRFNPILTDMQPEVFVELNPRTAAKLGIKDGDLVKVKTPTGEVVMPVKLTETVHPKVVSVPYHTGPKSPVKGLSWSNINNALPDTLDPHTEMLGYMLTVCRIEVVR